MPCGVEEACDAGGASVTVQRCDKAGTREKHAERREAKDGDEENDRRVAEKVLNIGGAPVS